uniref:PatA/PatG family cyanobactin maturation protease n=1 Tax=Candidatus Electronema sp. TaxID=2698783 RepID=UPI0040579164
MLESDIASLLPLSSLWAETTGSPEVLIAVLDGPADLSHPCFAGASLRSLGEDSGAGGGTAAQHGTHVASVIFAQHTQSAEAVQGIAPRCAGLLVPIFDNKEDGSIVPCSEIRLASALLDVLREAERLFPGKDTLPLIINISGGQFSRSGQGHPLLVDAVKKCAAKNALIVAAAGNEGCDCLHVPGSLPSVLAVGAMDADGAPLPMSNWGSAYQTQGILAPGQSIRGAQPGGGFAASSGTSFAAPVVSGVAALLLSLQLKLGRQPDPQLVRKAILVSVLPCDQSKTSDCRLYLAGVLNIEGAMSIISKGERSMAEQSEVLETLPDDAGAMPDAEAMQPEEVVMSSAAAETAITTINDKESEGVNMAQEPAKSKCGCGQEKWSDKFVYAIGRLEVDFVNQARQDSLQFHSQVNNKRHLPITQPINLLRYLLGWKETAVDGKTIPYDQHMYDAKSIYWTLWQNGTPIYVVQPMGPFAEDAYKELVSFYAAEQLSNAASRPEIAALNLERITTEERENFLQEAVELVAISGVIVGEARLSTGEVLPVVVPHMRGAAAWSIKKLCKELAVLFVGLPNEVIEQLLVRLYEETRNFGITPEERAVNYAATNVFGILDVAKMLPGLSIEQKWELDGVQANRSVVARSGSECYDVEVAFYNPDNLNQARRIAVVTVDVSDVVPVTIGRARHFSRR